MGKLDGCGRFSEQLNEMSKSILKQKSKNGETLNNKDIDLVENDIFQAYQAILSVLRDSRDISKAVEKMEKQVCEAGVTEVSKISQVVIKQTLSEKEIIKVEDNNFDVLKEDNIDATFKNNLYDKEPAVSLTEYEVAYMNNLLKKANLGDKNATGSSAIMMTLYTMEAEIKADPNFFNNARNKSRFFRRIAEAMVSGDDEIVLAQYLKNVGQEQLVKEDENGNLVLDEDKIKETLGEVCPSVLRKLEDGSLKQHVERRNNEKSDKMKKIISNNDVEKKSEKGESGVDEFLDKAVRTARERIIREKLNLAIKENDNDTIVAICRNDLEMSKKFLISELSYNQYLQQSGANSKLQSMQQKKCILLGNAINEIARNERTSDIEHTKIEENISSPKENPGDGEIEL